MQNQQKSLTDRRLDLSGGESVYCINESQMKLARRLVEEEADAHPQLKRAYDSALSSLSRNEQASLAFLIIDALNRSPRS